MPDEEFDVLGEEDLALLRRRLEHMYTNQKNARRSSGMCYRCGKHGHFIAECPEDMEVKPERKHRSRTDHKLRSRDDYKGKNKSERRPRKNGGHKKKKRAMVVGAGDIDSSSCYSSSSSSNEEENRHKGKCLGKNINGLCFAAQGFYGMAHSTASKKSNKDDSSSDSEEEVNNDPSFLIAENARLNDLLDSRDDALRKTNKEKREYRSLRGEAKEKVIELESLLVDARAQIGSLKSAPIVTSEPECTDCSTFLGELTVLKEKYASKVEELDVLRVELDEMKSRPSLLGACTSCPVLHEKLDVSLAYARSLEAQLKAPIPTICSTCELNVVKNMELAHYVDRLQDENDELRQLMGWLSGHEPQLRIMIEAFKRQDGEALGAKKVGEGSGESDVPEPPKTHHKNAFVPKPNHLRNRLDTTPNPPVFPPQTNNFQEPIKFKSVLGNEFFGKKGEKPSEEKTGEEKPEPKENPKPKPKPKSFYCEHCGRDGHLAEFCFKKKHEERLARELANKDRYRPSRGVPEPRLVPRGEGVVRTIYPRGRHQYVPRGEPPHR
jgi:hypothetical protein